MKVSQRCVSIVFLCLMTVVLLGVLVFYYFSLDNLMKNTTLTSVKDTEVTESKKVIDKQYLNHDVLKIAEVFDEGVDLSIKQLKSDDDRMSWQEEKEKANKEWIKDDGIGQMKQILLKNDLDYRILLNENMSVFNDIMDRYNTNHNYLVEEADRVGYDLNFNDFSVSAIFDQQDANYVYIAVSMAEYLTGGEISNLVGEVPGYATAVLLYKYNLSSDDFECLYKAYDVSVFKDEITETSEGYYEDYYKVLAQSDSKLYFPVEINAIDKDNNLILSLGNQFSVGLGGGGLPVVFEGLSGWRDLYFFDTVNKELSEFKYTEDETYYNSDLYDFLIFDYYPKHFDEDNYEGWLENYNDF